MRRSAGRNGVTSTSIAASNTSSRARAPNRANPTRLPDASSDHDSVAGTGEIATVEASVRWSKLPRGLSIIRCSPNATRDL